MANKAFGKFIDKGLSGARKKEAIRQEKREMRAEKNAYFEQKKAEKRGIAPKGSETPANKTSKRRPIPLQKTGGQTNSLSGTFKKTENKSYKKTDNKPFYKQTDNKPYRKTESKPYRATESKPYKTTENKPAITARPVKKAVPISRKSAPPKTDSKAATKTAKPALVSTSMPLNKFIAHAGVCSRRDAAELVKEGKVQVNGIVVTEPGMKLTGKEEVKVNGRTVVIKQQFVYILLNKPKDYITTTADPQGRKTVLDIVKQATDERVYPIGRLDRNTTGVLLFTNDGELAQKLSHPSYEIKKIYEVKLDRALAKKDFDAIAQGVTLEDGFIQPDAIAYADPRDRAVIGIEIHSGRNRIVRRIFEHLGYDVKGLDRVMFANLSKKNVDRGKWRFLSEKEVRLLKFLNASYTRKN